jgi:DNA-binding Lrp family transcriptional regulator
MKTYMCLSCKAGAYNKVLQGLMKLNIPRGDIFLLFGPIDIIVQFKGLKDMDEFVEKWFTPIRMTCCEETLITKTMTFVVVNEGTSYAEEPFAFTFLNIQPQQLENAQQALMKVPEVISADIVFGHYDIISPLRAKNQVDLERVISQIHETVPGIQGAATTIVAMIRI